MGKASVYQWERLSEDALWSLATDWRLAAEVRDEAMDRWLFPEDYGYGWAHLRVQQLRMHYLDTKLNQGRTVFETIPAAA